MYGYNEYISLSPEQILSIVSEKDIFHLFIKEEIITDKGALYKAPYRNDEHPDCYFEEFDNKLYFVDFADIPQSKNCFSFIQKCTNLNFRDSLQYIIKHLNLGKGNNPIREETTLKENKVVEVRKIKKDRVITFLPRKFNYKDMKFWSQYEISRQNLEEDKVIPIDLYKSTSRKGEPFVIKPLDIMYAYTDFDNNKVKIYRPYGNKEEKWFTNCTQNDIGNVDNLPISGDQLIISKSYKDCRVLRNQGLNVVWFQNEGMIPAPTLLVSLCKRFKSIIVWFDNDKAGIKSAKLVVSHINSLFPGKAKAIHLEGEQKDPSDYLAKKGKKELLKFLKEKQLIK